ncbi:histidinol-phosphate aminotransferase [Xylanibacillus composti]|uniref:Histidinol-phosphate aminotransferase n=1 Tax=Xylanibacillus composti TaxID=1572762 RepID=A0A8J4H6I2_9BACL|nr:histidinol-phosphate transaminase [Xylanibacillus composti]GIQ69593.1 histidinol-phosphate aminotransferase [Xylanibacillus composti]
MSNYWSKRLNELEPYVPGEQPRQAGLIKLNTNENPFPPSPRVMEAMKQAVNNDLRLYPDPTDERLRTTIASYYHLSEKEVFVGNGSDEILAFAFRAYFDEDRPILFPEISYSFYPVYAKLYGIPFRTVPVDESGAIDVSAFFQDNGGIVFPNPNAPTSLALSLEQVEEIVSRNLSQVVVVDEAYVDFGAQTALPLIRRYPNLLIVQTLSKSRSLAGLRVGLALGHPSLIEALNRVKGSFNSYTLDRVAHAGAVAAFEDEEYFQHTRSEIMRIRDRTIKQLQDIGLWVAPSSTNFLWVKHGRVDAEEIYSRLREAGILVRHFSAPRVKPYLRITIGTEAEMDALISQLSEILVR